MDDRIAEAVGTSGRSPVLAGIEPGRPAARGVRGAASGSTRGVAAEASEDDWTETRHMSRESVLPFLPAVLAAQPQQDRERPAEDGEGLPPTVGANLEALR